MFPVDNLPGKDVFPQFKINRMLSSPKILHKSYNMAKITMGEKVGIPSKGVESFYVNHRCIPTTLCTCGKVLWTTLWIMWKTPRFQQVFRLLVPMVCPVEKSAYSFVYSSSPFFRFRVTSPMCGRIFLPNWPKKLDSWYKTLSKNVDGLNRPRFFVKMAQKVCWYCLPPTGDTFPIHTTGGTLCREK